MHRVDSRRGYVGQGRRRRGRLMMIVMMMNAAPWVESIWAAVLDDAWWWRGWYSDGSSTQNCGAGRAAAWHGAAGYSYG